MKLWCRCIEDENPEFGVEFELEDDGHLWLKVGSNPLDEKLVRLSIQAVEELREYLSGSPANMPDHEYRE